MISTRFITLATIVGLLTIVKVGALPAVEGTRSVVYDAHHTHIASAADPTHTAVNQTEIHSSHHHKEDSAHPHPIAPFKQPEANETAESSTSTPSSTSDAYAPTKRQVQPMPMQDLHRDSSRRYQHEDVKYDYDYDGDSYDDNNIHYYYHSLVHHTPDLAPSPAPQQQGPVAIEYVTTTVEDSMPTDSPQARSEGGKSHRKHADARPTGSYYYTPSDGIGLSVVLGSEGIDAPAPLTFIQGRGRPGYQALQKKDRAKRMAKAALAARQDNSEEDATNDLPQVSDPAIGATPDPSVDTSDASDPTNTDPTDPDIADPSVSAPSTNPFTDSTDSTTAVSVSHPSDPNDAISYAVPVPPETPPAPYIYDSPEAYAALSCFCNPWCNPDIETAIASRKCVIAHEYTEGPSYGLPPTGPPPATQGMMYPWSLQNTQMH